MKSAPVLLLLFLGVAAALGQSGCGTSVGNPLVNIEFKSYTTASFGGMGGGMGIPFIAPAYAALSEVKLCFKRVRFKAAASPGSGNKDGDPDNKDFLIGEVILSSSGTTLQAVQLAPGVYRRVEFDLHSGCSSGKSVQVTNSNGIFSSNESIELKFNGTFTVSASDRTIALNVQPILTALDGVSSSGQVKSAMEGVEGDFND